MKKLLRVASIFMVSIFLVYALTGCQILGLARDGERRQLVNKVLQERYGDEFVVKDTWDNGGDSFKALAHPKKDNTLLFEGLYNLRGDGQPYKYIKYDQAIIAKQLKELIQPEIEALFGDCYIQPLMMDGSPGITDVTDLTIEEYVTVAVHPSVYFEIGVNAKIYSNADYREEYDVIVKTMKIINDLGIGVTIECYFLPEEAQRKFSTHYSKTLAHSYNFDSIVEGHPKAGMAVIEGSARQTYDEYALERKG